MNMFDLAGKNAVVTGAAMGMGKSCAVRLSEAGAYVNVLDLDPTAGNEIAELVGGSFFQTDVSKETNEKAATEQAAARTCTLDIVANNAGISPT